MCTSSSRDLKLSQIIHRNFWHKDVNKHNLIQQQVTLSKFAEVIESGLKRQKTKCQK